MAKNKSGFDEKGAGVWPKKDLFAGLMDVVDVVDEVDDMDLVTPDLAVHAAHELRMK